VKTSAGALLRSGLSRTILIVTALLAFALPAAQGADALCAQVKIQIQQKLSFERQAFDAKMSIDNGLNIPVQNISINLNFKDASGQGVVASSDPSNTAAVFFIAAPPYPRSMQWMGQGPSPLKPQGKSTGC